MQLFIQPDGAIRCLYDESVSFEALGNVAITRASHVEPDGHGAWWADLSPVSGLRLGPFSLRSQALAAEQQWLTDHVLSADQQQLKV